MLLCIVVRHQRDCADRRVPADQGDDQIHTGHDQRVHHQHQVRWSCCVCIVQCVSALIFS